jgi:hypothetical protein
MCECLGICPNLQGRLQISGNSRIKIHPSFLFHNCAILDLSKEGIQRYSVIIVFYTISLLFSDRRFFDWFPLKSNVHCYRWTKTEIMLLRTLFTTRKCVHKHKWSLFLDSHSLFPIHKPKLKRNIHNKTILIKQRAASTHFIIIFSTNKTNPPKFTDNAIHKPQ